MAAVNDLAQRLSLATPSQRSLHNNFIVSVNTTRRGLVRSAFYLVRIAESKVYGVLGYESVQAYALDTAGLSISQTRDLIYMGRKLSRLPEVAAALDTGALSWHKARMIIAKATPETESDLIDIAQSQTNEVLRNAVAASSDDEASDPPDPIEPQDSDPELASGMPEHDNHHSPASDSAVDRGTPSSPEEPLTETRGASPDAGASSTGQPATPKLHITLSFNTEEYARWEAALAAERSRGNRMPLGPLFLDALERTPAQPAGHTTPPDGPGTLLVVLECPQCRMATINTSRGERPAPRALIEASRCDALVESEANGKIVRRHVVPLGLRRAVMRRDRMACQAAGCHNNRNLEIHHRIPASQGGKTELDNLITLCRRCHRALHAQDGAAGQAVRAAQNLP